MTDFSPMQCPSNASFHGHTHAPLVLSRMPTDAAGSPDRRYGGRGRENTSNGYSHFLPATSENEITSRGVAAAERPVSKELSYCAK